MIANPRNVALLSPTTSIVIDERFVQGSRTIDASGGISAGFDMSLRVVEKGMEYGKRRKD
jgi:hypothetical protein